MTEPSIISIATAGPCNFTNLFGNLYYTQNMAPTSFLFSVDRANEIPRLPISATESLSNQHYSCLDIDYYISKPVALQTDWYFQNYAAVQRSTSSGIWLGCRAL